MWAVIIGTAGDEAGFALDFLGYWLTAFVYVKQW